MLCSVVSTIDKITDNLFLGGYGASLDTDNLQKLGVTCLIDVSGEQVLHNSTFDLFKFTVEDSDQSCIKIHFDTVADKIKEHKDKNGKTFLFCRAGISRSPTLCLAYLVKHEKLSLLESFRQTKESRCVIAPNPGFWRQLVEYEKEIKGENSVNFVQTVRDVPDLFLTNDERQRLKLTINEKK